MPEQINTVENRTAPPPPPPPETQPPASAPTQPPEPNAAAQAQNDINRSLGLGRAVDYAA